MLIPGRGYNSEKYRFAFNGKESDPEWKGTIGAVYDYGFRIYDSRTGKFLSVDPLTREFPWNSTYTFAENDVIRAIDLEGAEKKIVTHITFRGEDVETKVFTCDDVGPGGHGTLHLNFDFFDEKFIGSEFEKDIFDYALDINEKVDNSLVGNNYHMKVAVVLWGGDGGAEEEGWSADHKIDLNWEAVDVLLNSAKRAPEFGINGVRFQNNSKGYKNYNPFRPGSPSSNEQFSKMTGGLKDLNGLTSKKSSEYGSDRARSLSDWKDSIIFENEEKSILWRWKPDKTSDTSILIKFEPQKTYYYHGKK